MLPHYHVSPPVMALFGGISRGAFASVAEVFAHDRAVSDAATLYVVENSGLSFEEARRMLANFDVSAPNLLRSRQGWVVLAVLFGAEVAPLPTEH
ncbi:hypothetical protein NPJ82_02680 [Sphingomonas sp. NY01]|uniref:hypothetical protein n=1 Tax=Sphingomonas sp. NY01 TaxID=2968057 RepID=UPI00315C73A4